jgi:D-lyxose ketol-isomerase
LKAVFYEKAGIFLTEAEKDGVGIGTFFLDLPEEIGSACVTYFLSERCCARELAMLSWQTIPEHRHPPVGNYIGKEETFRCRWGRVYLYVSGESSGEIKGRVPKGKEDTFTVFHEIILNPGDQYTLLANSYHWFQGGPEGCVVTEFSTVAMDAYELYTDPEIMKNRRELGFQMETGNEAAASK